MRLERLESVIYYKNKGAFTRLTWGKQLKPLAQNKGMVITKITAGTVRVGVAYDNTKAVRAQRESLQLPQVNQGLPWGKWDIYPYIIAHKDNSYLRVTVDERNFKNFTSKYFVNGKEVTKDFAKSLCIASEFKSSETIPTALTINIANILAIK